MISDGTVTAETATVTDGTTEGERETTEGIRQGETINQRPIETKNTLEMLK